MPRSMPRHSAWRCLARPAQGRMQIANPAAAADLAQPSQGGCPQTLDAQPPGQQDADLQPSDSMEAMAAGSSVAARAALQRAQALQAACRKTEQQQQEYKARPRTPCSNSFMSMPLDCRAGVLLASSSMVAPLSSSLR